MQYIGSNIQLVSESSDAIKGNTYRANFLERGIVKYVDGGNHLLPNDAFKVIAKEFVGYPAIMFNHETVTSENVKALADCYISAVDFDEGYAYATFTSNNAALREKMSNGEVFVSCSYQNDDIESAGIHNGVEYTHVITANGLKPNHIAIGVDQPRYGDATVEKINSTKETEKMDLFKKKEDVKDEVKDEVKDKVKEKVADKEKDEADKEKDNALFSEDQISAIKAIIAEAIKGLKDNAEEKEEKEEKKEEGKDAEEDKKEVGQKNNSITDFIAEQQVETPIAKVSIDTNPNNHKI